MCDGCRVKRQSESIRGLAISEFNHSSNIVRNFPPSHRSAREEAQNRTKKRPIK